MKRTTLMAFILTASTLTATSAVYAHFLWIVSEPSEQPTQVHLYFSETAEADDPTLLDRVRDPQIVLLHKNGRITKLNSAKGEDSIVAKLSGDVQIPSVLLLNHRYGVITRGKSTFLLMYYAKNYMAGPKEWSSVDSSKLLGLDITPAWNNGRLQLQVLWKQKPAAEMQIRIEGPGIEDVIEGETTAEGTFSTRLTKPGLFSIRVRHVEKKMGELGNKKYDTIRHYSTLALRIPGKAR